MADIAIFRINYKSDFILTLQSDAGWMTPFCIKFWTGAPSQAYFAGYDGTTYTHCAPVEGDPTKLSVQFDDHHLPIGDLKFQIGYHFTVADFPTSVEDEVLNQASVIVEVDDAPAQVMLDLNGETAPEIEYSLPAYANEAQRIANEEQRIADEEARIQNEESRIASETVRQQNEETRIAQEEARVMEFARLKHESEAATTDANAAATLANEKAQLAADKAALAQAAATLAGDKAQLAADTAALAQAAANLANDKAALAQQKAEYAKDQGDYSKSKGDYAKEQGDYSKAQGDYAKDQGDYSKSKGDYAKDQGDYSKQQGDYAKEQGEICADDHLIAVEDHQTAAADHQTATTDHSTALSDHAQAGNDHTRAESDHTRAESDHAAVELYVDSLGVFDLSKHNAVGGVLATYADLSAALTALNDLDPKYKYGGMSFKFVQSSDNKYVRFNYLLTDVTTADTFTNVANWQGVDEEPMAGSESLVKSGGLFPLLYTWKLTSSISIIQQAYIDDSGNVNNTAAGVNNFDILIYDVTGISQVVVKGNEVGYYFRHYAFYSSEQISSETLIQLGSAAHNTTTEYYIEELATVPEGATHLAITRYKRSSLLLDAFKPAKKIDDLLERVLLLNSEVIVINEKIDIIDEQVITSFERISGKYITSNGNLETLNAYAIDYFPVVAGETYKISISNGVGTGRLYAVYSSLDFSSSTVIPPVGREMSYNSGSFEQTVTIPENGQYLALGYHNQSERIVIKLVKPTVVEKIEEIEEEISELKNTVYGNYGNIAVKLSSDGKDLYAAYLMDDGTEMTYWFRKCMANQLFTFYRVGYRTVTRKYPSTNGIAEGDTTIINATSSDNIGPLVMSNGGWVGGNHHYPEENVTPKYLTAQTDNYYCYADGKLLSAGDEVFCDTLTVRVVNTIFDPAIAPSEGDTILSTPLSTETAQYIIDKNTIEVSVRQQFSSTTTNSVSIYYGMQSMFNAETHIMTPLGVYTEWTAQGSVDEFTKGSYPNFNRFIEKNDNAYQASYIYPVKLGNHSLIGDSDKIFLHSSGKCYHHIMQNVSNESIKGHSFIWNGGYTFFHNPILDDTNAFVYSGTINGKDAIFVAAKQQCSIDIELPQDFLMRKINVIEQQGITTTDTATDVSGVHIEATGAGSLIFTLE